jgi:hypothetical protein
MVDLWIEPTHPDQIEMIFDAGDPEAKKTKLKRAHEILQFWAWLIDSDLSKVDTLTTLNKAYDWFHEDENVAKKLREAWKHHSAQSDEQNCDSASGLPVWPPDLLLTKREIAHGEKSDGSSDLQDFESISKCPNKETYIMEERE